VITPWIVGLLIGGAICWVVVRRELRKPGALGADGTPVTDDQKRTIRQTAAAIFAGWSIAAVVVALFFGDLASLVLAIIAVGIGLAALIRLGLPRNHPAWQWVAAAISRR
jgi:hypothetical protein